MGLLDWFINRPAQFDPDRASDQLTLAAIEKAIALVNPRLKLVPDYQQALAPAVEASTAYLRDIVLAVPPPLDVAVSRWSGDGQLRAFFGAAADIPTALARSRDLRTLFDKYPALDAACFILAMAVSEQQAIGSSLRGDVIQRDQVQTMVSFAQHQARICGNSEGEVRRLLGSQGYEYLLAQALVAIGEERSERRELEDNRALLRARLRLLQQQGPGLGSLFAGAPAASLEAVKLEAELLDNERAIEAFTGPRSALEAELEILRDVLANPSRYLSAEQKTLTLNTMNVVIDAAGDDALMRVAFSLAILKGVPESRTAFVLARVARGELPTNRIDFAEAARAL